MTMNEVRLLSNIVNPMQEREETVYFTVDLEKKELPA